MASSSRSSIDSQPVIARWRWASRGVLARLARALLATAAVIALAGAGGASTTAAARVSPGLIGQFAWSADGRQILFDGFDDRASAHSIYSVNADGSHLRRLTSTRGGADSEDPVVSPNGRSVAFVSDRNGLVQGFQIFVMNLDGSQQHSLTPEPKVLGGEGRYSNVDPAWSPDGRRIAFTRSDRGSGASDEIWVMNATGGHKHRVTRPGYRESPRDQPAWSPDGKRILFQFGTTMAACATLEIAVIEADGSGERILTNNGVCDYVGPWSPDGQQIAFTSDRSGSSEVYVMSPDGSGQRRLTHGGGTAPAWSPSGHTIAYTGANGGIYLIDVSGTHQRRLTRSGEHPAWSPDGRKIAYTHEHDETLHVINADGHNPLVIVR